MVGGLILAGAMRFGTVQASTGASGIPKPSVPEFTLKLVGDSYDVPATYSTDPYTGAKVLVEPAHHVNNGTMELWITNQPYSYSNGSTFHIYYDVRIKGHFEQGWLDLYPPYQQALGPNGDYGTFVANNCPIQSNSTYTIISYSAVNPPQTAPSATYPPNSQVDFRVTAIVGHDSQVWGYAHLGGPGSYFPAIAFDTMSDWSNTQTITISESQTPTSSPSPSPTATSSPATTPTSTPYQEPQQTEQIEPIVSAAIVVAVIIAVLGLLIYLIKRK
jgi:hypothetical protein